MRENILSGGIAFAGGRAQGPSVCMFCFYSLTCPRLLLGDMGISAVPERVFLVGFSFLLAAWRSLFLDLGFCASRHKGCLSLGFLRVSLPAISWSPPIAVGGSFSGGNVWVRVDAYVRERVCVSPRVSM
jgi:hypothetical protein